MKKILIVAATVFEIQPFLDFLKKEVVVKKSPIFTNYTIDVLITGVGMVNMAIALTKNLTEKSYDLALNVGIGGSFSNRLLRGAVVEVISERYGDLGTEEATGAFSDMFELGLISPNEKPFLEGKLVNTKPLSMSNLPLVHGLTVQKVHGFALSIRGILQKYGDIHVETMEGAAFFQVCLTEGVRFTQIRGISNFVEPRNRENWLIQEAIENLNSEVISLFRRRVI